MGVELNLVIPAIITGFLGFTSGLVLNKLSRRSKVISYTKSEQLLSPYFKEGILGNIEIFLKGRKIERLKFITFELTNNSSTDFENVLVKFSVNKSNVIQGSEAYVNDGVTWIEYTDKYAKVNEEASIAFAKYMEEVNLDDPEFWTNMLPETSLNVNYTIRNREYKVVTLSQPHKYIFSFLVEESVSPSEMYISIIHKGLRLQEEKDEQKQMIEFLLSVSIIGLVVSVLLLWWLIETKPWSINALIIVSSIIGFMYSVFGLLITLAYRAVKNFFDL